MKKTAFRKRSFFYALCRPRILKHCDSAIYISLHQAPRFNIFFSAKRFFNLMRLIFHSAPNDFPFASYRQNAFGKGIYPPAKTVPFIKIMENINRQPLLREPTPGKPYGLFSRSRPPVRRPHAKYTGGHGNGAEVPSSRQTGRHHPSGNHG